ncbi:MAG: carboxyl transferase [Clostridia bacterium]|nr:carboxyl transferase [Clostridia bacterium]
MSKQASEARKCLEQFFDAGTFVEVDRLMRDGENDVPVVCGYGLVNDAPVYAFAQDKTVCSGAVGKAHAAKIKSVYHLAAQNGAPVVGVFDSDGARLGEGLDAMDAIAEIMVTANELSGVVPQIAVITGSCVGSSALIAAAADVVIAAEDADYYLNVGDDNAKADVIAADATEALEKARQLLGYLPANNLSAAPVYEALESVAAVPTSAKEAAAYLADAESLFPLYKDEVAALARINGVVCGIVTLAGEQVSCCAAARAARFVRFCDGFSLPVLTVVDAEGFECLKGAARVCQAYTEATTAKVTLLIGKAYGPVYIAVAGKAAGADAVLAWQDASVSPLKPETAIHILWKDRLAEMKDPKADRAALAEEYRTTCCNAQLAAEQGAVTDIIAPEQTRATVSAFFEMLSGKRVSKLPKKHANIRL